MFFLFKQKTAFDMRLSDWSSDVCSSDLQGSAPISVHPGRFRGIIALQVLPSFRCPKQGHGREPATAHWRYVEKGGGLSAVGRGCCRHRHQPVPPVCAGDGGAGGRDASLPCDRERVV